MTVTEEIRADNDKKIKILLMAQDAMRQASATGAIAGQFPCKLCGTPFHWQRASNGHFRGACETKGCASFIQ